MPLWGMMNRPRLRLGLQRTAPRVSVRLGQLIEKTINVDAFATELPGTLSMGFFRTFKSELRLRTGNSQNFTKSNAFQGNIARGRSRKRHSAFRNFQKDFGAIRVGSEQHVKRALNLGEAQCVLVNFAFCDSWVSISLITSVTATDSLMGALYTSSRRMRILRFRFIVA